MVPWLGTCLQLTKVKVRAVGIAYGELPTLDMGSENIVTRF